MKKAGANYIEREKEFDDVNGQNTKGYIVLTS